MRGCVIEDSGMEESLKDWYQKSGEEVLKELHTKKED